MAFASYRFGGALKGLSVSNYFAVQHQRGRSAGYRENRLSVAYDF